MSIQPQSAQLARYEPRRGTTAAAITAAAGAYVLLGTTFANPARIVKIQNLIDADLDISIDGITAYDVVPSQGGWIYDYSSDRSNQAGCLEVPAGTQFYVKYNNAGSTNSKSVYLVLIYASAV